MGSDRHRAAGYVVSQETNTLDHVLALTERVQTAISDGEWAAAAKLEVERRELLARYLEQERGDRLDRLAPDLTDLQNTHNQILGELFHHRRRLVREATTVRTGRRAIRAYGEHEQPPEA